MGVPCVYWTRVYLEGSIKSVCLSVYPFTNFLRIGSLSFFIFCINVRFYELKLTELDFSRKFSLAQFQAKRTINCPENNIFA